KLYRSKHTTTDGPPFGGRDMGSAPTERQSVLPGKALRQSLTGLLGSRTGRLTALGLTGGLLLFGGVGLWLWKRSPEVQARQLLGTLPKEQLRDRFEPLAEGDASPKQWGALRYLEASQDTEGLDLVALYMTAVGSEDCGVRAKAARRLGALGSMDAVSALTK